MENWINNFVVFLEKDKKLSNNTLQSYRRDIEQYVNYIDSNSIDLMKTNKTTVISYLVYLQKEGRATSTISRNLASIRSFYQYLVRMKQIEDNPTVGLESPKLEKKLPTVLSVNEINLLLEQPKCVDLKGYRDKAMLEMLYATGIRVSELMNLNIEDIDLEGGFIKCKGATKERVIPVGHTACNAISEYLIKLEHLCYMMKKKKLCLLTQMVEDLQDKVFGKLLNNTKIKLS